MQIKVQPMGDYQTNCYITTNEYARYKIMLDNSLKAVYTTVRYSEHHLHHCH